MDAEPLIAVVDDDAGTRMSLDALVRSLGYRTAVFGSAEEFLDRGNILEACVISDIEMPGGLDGIELTSALLAMRPERPVILISAFVDERVRSAAADAGAFALVKKPFLGEKLIEAIDAALSAERSCAEARGPM